MCRCRGGAISAMTGRSFWSGRRTTMLTTRTLLRARLRPSRRARKAARRTALAIGVTLAAFVVARLGVGAYVSSARGKAAVAANLQSMIGMPVEVADVDVGTRTTAVKFRVLDPSAENRPEVLAVESAAADV